MLELTNIKNMLTLFKPELAKRYPIASLGLFGSVVRDDFKDELETKLNHKVDLVSKAGIKQKYFTAIESEIVYI